MEPVCGANGRARRSGRIGTTGLTRLAAVALALVALWRFAATGGGDMLFETLRLAISREPGAGAAGPQDVAAAPPTPPWELPWEHEPADDGAGEAATPPVPAAGAAPAPSVVPPRSPGCASADLRCIRASAVWDCASAALLLEGERAPADAALEMAASASASRSSAGSPPCASSYARRRRGARPHPSRFDPVPAASRPRRMRARCC
jgi:hypothetical protein